MMKTSQAVHFGTAEMIKNETKSTIIKSVQQIINTYHGRGFRIKHILGDHQFKCKRKYRELQGININITGERSTCAEGKDALERLERARTTVNTHPFVMLPHHLIVQIVFNVVFWLNCFPYKSGIHPKLKAILNRAKKG